MQEAFDEVKNEAEQKGIYLTLEKPAEIADKIMADAPKLKESLYNLIDNAVKYTEKGGVTVKLQIVDGTPKHNKLATGQELQNEQNRQKDNLSATSHKLQIAVKDTGIGMTPVSYTHLTLPTILRV